MNSIELKWICQMMRSRNKREMQPGKNKHRMKIACFQTVHHLSSSSLPRKLLKGVEIVEIRNTFFNLDPKSKSQLVPVYLKSILLISQNHHFSVSEIRRLTDRGMRPRSFMHEIKQSGSKMKPVDSYCNFIWPF